jgi:Tfp pilus assembly protein PilE
MRDRGKLAQMTRLTAVQRARRAAAEAALHDARSGEQKVRSEEEAAQERSLAAQEQWRDHLDRPGFSPEYSRSLSTVVIAREKEGVEAAARTQRAVEISAERQADWQAREATVRLSESSLRTLRRRVNRRREENRLNEVADRITYAWCKP